MNLQKLITNHVNFNLWANQEFVNWLSEKSDAQLKQEVKSSYTSILKTLNHIWAVEEFWYAVITNTENFEMRFGVEDPQKEDVLTGLINRSSKLADVAQYFTEAELNEKIQVNQPWLKAEQCRYEYLLQCVNHATYHRGQIVTIARNTGITDAPNTDFVNFSARK